MKPTLLLSCVLAGAMMVGCASDTQTKDIDIAAVPAQVMHGFNKAYPDVKITDVERETYVKSGAVYYEFEFVGADGDDKTAEFNEQGKEIHEQK